MSEWWAVDNGVATTPCWWAVEHLAGDFVHPAFYLRSLMPGDFGPLGQGPLPRHAFRLTGEQLENYPVRCQTCNAIPDPMSLEPIERVTGDRGRDLFFRNYVFRLKPWPPSTSQATCWNCCSQDVPPREYVNGRHVCPTCAIHMRAFPQGGKS